jgi:hypothetical protein
MAQQIASGAEVPELMKAGAKSFRVKLKNGFLDHLAATGSVDASAAAIGIAPLQAYAACRTDPVFAEGWRAALRVGYDRLEAMMIERTGAVLTGGAEGPLETPDMLFALRLLDRQRGAQMPGATPEKARAADRTDTAILKRLAMLGKRQAAEEARKQVQGGGDA